MTKVTDGTEVTGENLVVSQKHHPLNHERKLSWFGRWSSSSVLAAMESDREGRNK